jgi:hypothetical protein
VNVTIRTRGQAVRPFGAQARNVTMIVKSSE